jgi:hypothetical protein
MEERHRRMEQLDPFDDHALSLPRAHPMIGHMQGASGAVASGPAPA